MHNRRQWLKNSVGLGGLLLTPSIGLSAKEIELYRPRPLEKSIRLITPADTPLHTAVNWQKSWPKNTEFLLRVS